MKQHTSFISGVWCSGGSSTASSVWRTAGFFLAFTLLFSYSPAIASTGNSPEEVVSPPSWNINPSAFQFNMNLVVRVKYNGAFSNATNNMVGVFVGKQLRGVATPVNVGGQQYYFVTAYSNQFTGETLKFKVYYAADDIAYPVAETATFMSNQTYGTLASPFVLNIDPNADFPPEFEQIAPDTTIQTVAFSPVTLSQYLINCDGDAVTYSYQAGSNLAANIVNGVLSVGPALTAWTGTDTVRITATDQTSNQYSGSVTAYFTILPFYPGPDMGTVPSQSVEQGSTFSAFDLDSYLTYSGPCRSFRYYVDKPAGSMANPGWSVVPPGSQSMVVIARPQYGNIPLLGTGSELAAFVGGTLVGKATASGTAPDIVYSLQLANLASGPITFRFYDATNQYLFEKTTTQNFVPGGSLGLTAIPYNIEFAPLAPQLSSNGNVQMNVADPNWVGTFPVHFVVTDCDYPFYYRTDTSTAQFTVFIDYNPEITSSATANFIETSCYELYDAQSADRTDSEGSGLTYSIAGGADAALFTIDPVNGKLSWNSFTPDFESPGDANGNNQYEVTIRVTNALNLTDDLNLTVTVTDNAQESFNPQINGGAPACLSGTSITLTASGGGTYLWSTGATTVSETVTAPGIYYVTVDNGYGCIAVAQTEVSNKPSITASGNSTPVCQGAPITLSSTPSGGAGIYPTFSWSGPASFSSSLEDPVSFPALPASAGTYTVIVTDSKGCTASAVRSITVSSNVSPAVSLSVNAPVCDGSTMQLSASVTGGVLPYSGFSWVGPGGYTATQQNPSTLAYNALTGNYTLTVTDNVGCTATSSLSVTVLPKALITAASNSPVCLGANINLSSVPSGGTAPYASFVWSGPNGYIANTEDPAGFASLATSSGTYRVTMTDASGCTATSSVAVTAVQPPVVSIDPGPTCSGGTVSLEPVVSGGALPYSAYSWSGPNGFSSTLQFPAAFALNGSSTGTYSLTVTDANGCTATATKTVTINASPAISASASGGTCQGAALSLNSTRSGGTAPFQFLWSGPAGYSATTEDPAAFVSTMNSIGDYYVTVTDANGCTASASTKVQINANPVVTVTNNGPLCTGATAQLGSSATGGSGTFTGFSWNGPASFSSVVQNPASFSATFAKSGIYSVTVTDSNGCTGNGTTNLGISSNPVPTITASSNGPLCTYSTLTLTSIPSSGTGTYTSFNWTGPNGFTSSLQDPLPITATASVAGAYSVTVTDNGGCTASATVGVIVGGPGINVSKTDVSCAGVNSGSISVSNVGGTPPYNYLWNTGAVTQTISNLAPGTYTVTLTPTSGGTCSASTSVTIFDNSNLSASILMLNSACNGMNGSATITTDGGVAPFTFAWPSSAGFQVGPTATNLAAGNYTVTVTDAQLCTTTVPVAITSGSGAIVNPVPNKAPLCPGQFVGATPISSNPPGSAVVFSWSGASARGLADGSATGTSAQIPAFTTTNTLGSSLVVLTATLGTCVSSTAFTVEVVDAVDPVITHCPVSREIYTTSNGTGDCEGVIPNLVPELTATDNCTPFPVLSVQQSIAPGSIFEAFLHTDINLDFTVTDVAGNTSTCRAVLTPIDDEDPQLINCPPNISVDIANQSVYPCSRVEPWAHPTVTDNCVVTLYDVRITNPDGTFEGPDNLNALIGASVTAPAGFFTTAYEFPLGTSVITYFARDDFSNTTSCTFTVKVSYVGSLIGDRVWHDLDGDGVQGTGEPGIAGAPVTMTGVTTCTGSAVTYNTVTDASGNYLFTAVPPGRYKIRFTTPSGGYYLTNQDAGFDELLDSDAGAANTTDEFNVYSGDTIMRFDAGFWLATKIGSLVWDDLNGNGMQDIGEPGIPGVNVILNGTEGDGDVVNLSTTTNVQGLYEFGVQTTGSSTLAPGTYNLTFVLPAGGYVPTRANDADGTDMNDSDADEATGATAFEVLTSGENNPAYDAGFYLPPSIGDYTWIDANANGIQEAVEPPLQEAWVYINGTTGQGDTVSLYTKTDINGRYSFDNLVPGVYQLTFAELYAPLSKYVFTFTNRGGDDERDSDPEKLLGGRTIFETLVSGEHNNSYDGGFYAPVSVGNLVWHDVNANGLQDPDEPGIPGVSVKLLNAAGLPVTVDADGNTISDQITDANGHYRFTNLVPTSYRVRFTNPDIRYTLSKANQGTDDAQDCDADAITFTTHVTTLATGIYDQTLDAAYYIKGRVGNLAWHDINGNGVQDSGEPGLSNTAVTLTGTDGFGTAATSSTTTDANGFYTIGDIVPGSYKI
ncbi:MAG: SdrD B-like domain-containing protein, partial [Bacteroidota bacterium]